MRGEMTENTAERMLLDLLAVIHRDGGHYTKKHGVVKSWKDAMHERLAKLKEDHDKLIDAVVSDQTIRGVLSKRIRNQRIELARLTQQLKTVIRISNDWYVRAQQAYARSNEYKDRLRAAEEDAKGAKAVLAESKRCLAAEQGMREALESEASSKMVLVQAKADIRERDQAITEAAKLLEAASRGDLFHWGSVQKWLEKYGRSK